MANKRDFMSELAREIDDKKSGKVDHIQGVEDFTPKERKVIEEDDFDIPKAVHTKKVEPEYEEPDLTLEEPISEEEDFEEDAYGGYNGRPASFGEEAVVRVDKPKKHIPIGVWIALGVAVVGIAFAIYWFGFAPHIELPNFVGKNISEVSTWAKQNKMESSAIATSEPVYSLEYEKGVVVSQSKEAGTKVKTDTPITFTVSNGPDPDEQISFPTDIKSMTKDEINDWISENQLLKAKVVSQYSDTVENGNVISYEVKNGSEEDFTRNTTLNVTVSKGPAPAGQITVTDFVGKLYTEVESWAKTKKVNIDKQESFSDSIQENYVISMSKKSGDTMSEGDTLTVVVSKGKGVTVPNLVGYTAEQYASWKAGDGASLNIVPSSVYSTYPEGSIISQNISAGTVIGKDDVLELKVSLYLPILETNSRKWLGSDYLELKAQVDEWNSKGASIQAGQYGSVKEECSDTYTTPGQITEYHCEGGTSSVGNGCERPLTLTARISYTVSTGGCTVTPTVETFNAKEYKAYNELNTYAGFKDIKFTTINTEDTQDLEGFGSDYDYGKITDTDGNVITDGILTSGHTYVVYVPKTSE